MEAVIKYSELCEILFRENANIEMVFEYIKEKINADELTEEQEKNITNFHKNFKARYSQCKSFRTYFFQKNEQWLNTTLTFKKKQSTDLKAGRPSKSFIDSAPSTKRKKIYEVSKSHESLLIQDAFIHNLETEKKLEERKIVKTLKDASPRRIKRIVSSIKTPEEPKTFSSDEALALIYDLGLSVRQYKLLRTSLKSKNINVLPSYEELTIAKEAIIPTTKNVTEISIKIPLQDLLNKTAERLLLSLSKEEAGHITNCNLVMMTKWGCDGSSGQSMYKQKIIEGVSDEHLFMASFVPLRLITEIDSNIATSSTSTLKNNEIWRNNTPSSKNFCRPFYYEYAKETKEKITEVVATTKAEIANLEPFHINFNNKLLTIRHQTFLTMIDGKVAQVITNTSSTSSCIICKAKPSQLNDINRPAVLDQEALSLGISPLHARMRIMEHILHTAYDISFGSMGETVRNSEVNHGKREEEKKRIQEEFKTKMGLLIDMPKQSYGNTNDGNTARTFFENPEATSEITKINIDLLKRLKVILVVLASNHEINPIKFHEYSIKTARLYLEHYSWRNMSPTLHKILVHGKEIIENNLLPLGELSEEAQECKNKDYKIFRLSNTRKNSRLNQNEDLINILLLSSDPFIARLRQKWNKRKYDLNQEDDDYEDFLDLTTCDEINDDADFVAN